MGEAPGSLRAAAAKTRATAPTTRKGARQPPRRASSSPAGTPRMEASEKPEATMAVARPRCDSGARSATIEKHSVAAMPPKEPAAMRAATSVHVPVAMAPLIVDSPRPKTDQVKTERRSQRSSIKEPAMPTTVAAAV